jgi:hypothetical protein
MRAASNSRRSRYASSSRHSRYAISSLNQISPNVLSALRGRAGAAGAAGSAGPVGAPGGPGSAGKEGPAGKEGKEGPVGKEGKEGKEGPEGEEGSPWTLGGVLPHGKTETGVWSYYDVGTNTKGQILSAAISFPIPLEEAPVAHLVKHKEWEENKDPEGCKGTIEKPQAEPGNLCAFEHPGEGVSFLTFFAPGGEAAEATGAVILFESTGEPIFTGTWAVTGK